MANQVLIQFYLSQKNDDQNKFLFWSCALNTEVSQLDYALLENCNKPHNIKNQDFIITAKFADYNSTDFSDYQKRNPVFLSHDKNSSRCSPYISSCAELENYYNSEFQTKFIKFITEVEIRLDKEYSEYEKLQIQESSISEIKNIIGIDILEQESIPGSIAVYKRLPKFEVAANYNSANGERYIKFSFEKKQGYEYLLEIEILDGRKILYKQLHNLIPNQNVLLPNTNELEDFGYVHLSVFEKKDKSTRIVYEESGHLIRYFSFGINTGGGNYKVLQNRFTEKKLEKVALTNYSKTNSRTEDFDPFRLEQDYKALLKGKSKKYLENHFFSDDESGRNDFLMWTRNVLQRAKEVFIIDPFFDNNGFNDFNSCATTYFSLTVLTTDPAKCLRDNQSDISVNSSDLVKTIQSSFQNAKVYYVDRAKLHDRYLIVFGGEETTYFSLSNSWNGTVNNYSLFVQELELKIALQVKETYSKYLSDEYLQKLPVVNESQENKKSVTTISDKKIKKLYDSAKNLSKTISNKHFYRLFNVLFNAIYHGNENVDKFDLLTLCVSKFVYVKNPEKFISTLVFEVLVNQKQLFTDEQKFITNDAALEEFTNIEKCYHQCSTRHFCSGLPYYDLRIKYEQYKILEASFAVYPELVINELCRQEKDICLFNNGSKQEIRYFVSEQIISCMLSESFYYFPEQNTSDLIDFANKTNNLYCKVYICQWILDNDESKDFESKLNYLKTINLAPADLSIVLGMFYSNLIRIKTDAALSKEKLIEDFIYQNYNSKEDCLILFSINAYLSSYEIDYEHFYNFLEKNKNCKEDLNNLFLLFALNSVPSRKLFDVLKNTIDIKLLEYLPQPKENPSTTDVGKYINYIPYLGQILKEQIKKNPSLLKNIIYKFDIYPNFIFELNTYPKDEFDCYVLFIILCALCELKKDGIDITKEINKIKWYVTFLLNMHNDDYYGLSFRILDVYVTFLTNDEKISLINALTSVKNKAFIYTVLQKNNHDSFSLIQSIIEDYRFERYDNTNKIVYLLALFINLIFYNAITGDNKEIIGSLLEKIKELFLQNIKSEKIQITLSKGLLYYSNANEEDKKAFIDEIKNLYCPFTSEDFIEEYDE